MFGEPTSEPTARIDVSPCESPETLLARASQLLRSGEVIEAIAAHERLLKQRPDLADSWYNLAYLQQRARRYDAALASYRQALDRGAAGPEEVHLNRAVIFADHMARPDEAEREIGMALSLNPRYVPALLNLGNLHEQRGDRGRALAAYQQVLAIDPFNALALARLPNVTAITSAQDPMFMRLRQAIARPGVGAAERADLGFGLGKALDDVGAYDEAYAAYTAANHASRLSAGTRGARYDAAAHESFVDRIIRAFPVAAAPVVQTGARSPHVFICGMFRSGSTLVERMLASHPRVTAGGEIDLIPAMVREHLGPTYESPTPIDAARLEQLRALYDDGMAALFPGTEFVTDKRPDNFLHIGLIKALFPDSKIVHTRRDPIDNCLSIFFLHLGHSMPYALDLLDVAHWYRQYLRLMAHWKSLYGDALHDVDYDRLVAEPQPLIERLLDYCELPQDDACMAFHNTKAVVKTPSAWQVRQPLYMRSSGRWRNYERHLDRLRAVLADPV